MELEEEPGAEAKGDEQDRHAPVAPAFGASPGEIQTIREAHGSNLRADRVLGKRSYSATRVTSAAPSSETRVSVKVLPLRSLAMSDRVRSTSKRAVPSAASGSRF